MKPADLSSLDKWNTLEMYNLAPKALTLRGMRGLMIIALTLITRLSLTQVITVSEKPWNPGTLQPLTRRTRTLARYQDNAVEPLYNGHLGTYLSGRCREVAVMGRLSIRGFK